MSDKEPKATAAGKGGTIDIMTRVLTDDEIKKQPWLVCKTNLKIQRVPVLKILCKHYNLPTTGLKKDLIERLLPVLSEKKRNSNNRTCRSRDKRKKKGVFAVNNENGNVNNGAKKAENGKKDKAVDNDVVSTPKRDIEDLKCEQERQKCETASLKTELYRIALEAKKSEVKANKERELLDAERELLDAERERSDKQFERTDKKHNDMMKVMFKLNADIATNKADIVTNKADIATNTAGIASNGEEINNLMTTTKKQAAELVQLHKKVDEQAQVLGNVQKVLF